MIRMYLGAGLLALGAVTFVISLLGVFRFRYVLNRLHAAAIADTLGTLLTMLGLILLRGISPAALKMLLVVVLMWLTGPVCVNRIAAAEVTVDDEYKKHCK